jgi:nucleotide-binding universal stress UspA family protein
MKILVPVDGSPASIRAVRLAVDQIKALPDPSLVLVNVQNFRPFTRLPSSLRRSTNHP